MKVHNGNGLRFRGKPKEQLYAYIVKNPTTGCWLWQGALFKSGYGQINNDALEKSPTTAHRASWQIHIGKIPKGMMVLHKCDVRHCVNPEHLYLGTNRDNMIDRSQRGYVHQRKLNEEDVIEMRQLRQQGWSWRKLAARYGVATNAVIEATMGRSWSFVTEPIPSIKIGPGRRPSNA